MQLGETFVGVSAEHVRETPTAERFSKQYSESVVGGCQKRTDYQNRQRSALRAAAKLSHLSIGWEGCIILKTQHW